MDDDLVAAVRTWFPAQAPQRIGVAVSGGGDSVALLDLLHRAFAGEGVELLAATVDHGLRPEAAEEARNVSTLCEQLGVSHTVLRWQGWDGSGNMQDQARRARYTLLTGWALDKGIELVALGHTADDQAETVLMRLGRAAGASGLAAMSPRRTLNGVTLVRPLLEQTRAELRSYLVQRGIDWAEDPSNVDRRFDRIKAREAISSLAPLGITVASLSEVARNMAQVRDALDWYVFLAARDIVSLDAGDVLIDLRGYRTLPEEIARRLLLHCVTWVGGGEYGPRRLAVAEAMQAIRHERPGALGHCLILRQGRSARICREYHFVKELEAPVSEVWDGRWALTGPSTPGAVIRALGPEGLIECLDWRQTGRPRQALLSSPSVWKGERLLAAPSAGNACGWCARRIGGDEEFYASLLSH
ncbi:tRNA lysidine(34) synthetase TilS [Lutimaribacter marinistellae]|uniref:tRNA(Ile)-lysidine synthase n=1 Tax=Lutimaribacter marinistellae TaxID=1820329 RepID=A0ABV7TFU2_9RHOB